MNDFDNEEQSIRTMRGDTKDETLGRIDQYDIIRKLGGGGFGVVYLVRDTLSNVEYAIKTLHPLLKSNPEEMENLRSQFKLVSKLIHSHIAPAMYLHPGREIVYANDDVRKDLRFSSGDFVMVMKYAPGVTLSQWRKQFPNGIVPVDKAIDICKQVASALDYAHSEKIIHRDIKPSNIMVETRDDKSVIARVLDFGLAAEIRSSMSRVSTEKGDTSGTRPYMAPEQWQGKKQGAATDQYALACMFYELVSGAVPFAGAFETGDFQIMLNSVKSETPDTLDELSEEQNNAVLKALSKDMKQRFASCGDLIAALSGEIVNKKAFTIPEVSVTTSTAKRIICKNCKTENDITSLFCEKCGTKIERDDICSKCGAELGEAQMFCRKCGEKTPLCIAEEKAEVERKAREKAEAERVAREKAESERKAREKAESERKAREEAERKAREKAEAERKAREKAERKAREKAEAERKAREKEEAERQAREKAEAKRRRRSALKKLIILCICIIVSFFVYNHVKKQQELLEICIPELINNIVQIPETNFLIGRYEVTQAQWQAIMGNNPSYFRGDLHRPVEQVSWNDCQKFIKKLNARTEIKSAGITFRLPTEEEWEYACRAGSRDKYGLLADRREGSLDEMGWYGGYSGNSGSKTHPVGQKKPNAWGLYDMHGNVDEWTASADGSCRIYRGGSYYDDASYCESGDRYWDYPGNRSDARGFRLAASRTGK